MPRPGPSNRDHRALAVGRLAELLTATELEHPVRVAVDGVDGAGKTTLADELADAVTARGRPYIRASIDGFHRPRAERYRRGRSSPEGYYEDSFDLDAFRRELLEPLGPDGDRRYRVAIFDHRSDAHVSVPVAVAPPNAIALVDGIFLLRPEIADHWDLAIFLSVRPERGAGRALRRDRDLTAEDAAALFRTRYLPAQQHYLRSVRPHERADVVVLNDDPEHPEVLVRPRVG